MVFGWLALGQGIYFQGNPLHPVCVMEEYVRGCLTELKRQYTSPNTMFLGLFY